MNDLALKPRYERAYFLQSLESGFVTLGRDLTQLLVHQDAAMTLERKIT
jgi:hypothetical protein